MVAMHRSEPCSSRRRPGRARTAAGRSLNRVTRSVDMVVTLRQVLAIESFRSVADSKDAKPYYLLRPAGELDAYTVAQFREALAQHASSGRLVVDLCRVPFMDSAGLGALIGGIRRVRENDGSVVVFCNVGTLIRLLHTTGFDRIVPVEETLEAAVAALDRA